MASRLNPYISFRSGAREAMEFYADVFGGTPAISTFGEYGATGADADGVMHAMLETPAGFVLMASDTPPGRPHEEGSSITISLSGDDDAELRGYWDKLADGGTVMMALEKQMWGDVFGMCVDRFGIAWLVNITQPAA
jgi:PhnB protein